MTMPTTTELNNYKRSGAVAAIREALKKNGVSDPGYSDIYPIFSKTEHAKGEEIDKPYLYQTISSQRKKDRGGAAAKPGAYPSSPTPTRTAPRLTTSWPALSRFPPSCDS